MGDQAPRARTLPAWAWALIGGLIALMLAIPITASLLGSDEPSDTTVPLAELTTTEAPTTPPPAFEGCPATDGSSPQTLTFTEPPPFCLNPAVTYTAVITTNVGDISFAVDVSAPQAANTFIYLARFHYYDGGGMSAPFVGGGQNRSVIIGSDGADATDAGFTVDVASEIPGTGRYAIGDVIMPPVEPSRIGSRFAVITADDSNTPGPDSPVIGSVTTGQDIADQIAASDSGVAIISVVIVES